MTKISCIIVDDEPLAVEMLSVYVQRTETLQLLSTFTDSVQAFSAISQQKPDLVFMDIQMPDLNGMELSRLLPEDTRVIFTTAFKQFAYDSYQVEAVDYLLKPISYQKFLEAVAKAEKWFQVSRASGSDSRERRSAFIKVDGGYRNIYFDDIAYVSGMKDYVMIHLDSDPTPLITHMTLRTVEDMLPSEMFMRVHRSHIVALDKIMSIDSFGDIMLAGSTVPVSDTYRKSLENYIRQRLLSK